MPQQQAQRTSKSPRPNNSPRPNRAGTTPAQGNALGKRRQTNTHKFHRPNGAGPTSAQGNALGKRGQTNTHKCHRPSRAAPMSAQGNALGNRGQTKDPSPQRGGPNSIAQRHTNDAIDPPRWGSAVNGRVQKPRALPWAGLPLPTSGRETDRFSPNHAHVSSPHTPRNKTHAHSSDTNGVTP